VIPSAESVTAAGIWIAALSFIGLLIRQIGPWKRQVSEAEEHLRNDLLRRVEKLERTLDRERTRHNAERALDRHRLNNVTQCFDALLLLIKANPDKAGEVVVMIEEMRAKQLIAEAEEKAIIRAAEIAADETEAEESRLER
jgi:7,8-dihydro-6-hydroxymethylpterin-pyrophosphokinase